MAASISSSIVASLKAFNALVEKLNSTDPDDLPESLSIGQWEDELGRLRMWAANIGAHKTGQSSLDFRLRDASHIRNQILKLLKNVEASIDSAQELLFERPDSDEETFSDDDGDDEREAPGSILEELLASLAAIIKSLFQLSMLVRKPAQHDLYAGSSRADVAAFEPFYYGHVRDKFPDANESLISRLGSAIARRKMYLKYRERHAAKLRQGINILATGTHGETNEGATTVMSDTVATDIRNWNIDFEESASVSGETQTSYAATLMKGGSLTVPPPPKESLEGNPFECPLCYYIVRIESTQSWNKHVFLDLQPYICLDMGCKTPQKLYATRHDWLRHMEEDHPDTSDPKSICQEESICPLCGEVFKNDLQLRKHSARHLQDLALFVLPQSLYGINQEEEEEEEDPNTQGSRENLVVESPRSRFVESNLTMEARWSDLDPEGWNFDDHVAGELDWEDTEGKAGIMQREEKRRLEEIEEKVRREDFEEKARIGREKGKVEEATERIDAHPEVQGVYSQTSVEPNDEVHMEAGAPSTWDDDLKKAEREAEKLEETQLQYSKAEEYGEHRARRKSEDKLADLNKDAVSFPASDESVAESTSSDIEKIQQLLRESRTKSAYYSHQIEKQGGAMASEGTSQRHQKERATLDEDKARNGANRAKSAPHHTNY